MKYINENLPKKFLIGISVRTSNENDRFHKEVQPLWERFYLERLVEKIPNRIDENLLAVYTNYEKDYTKAFTYTIGCEVSHLNKVPKGLVGIEIPASHYAIFSAIGEFPQSLNRTWQNIWVSKIKRAYKTDFEVYVPDFDLDNKSEVKIYISL